jgi:hypothetical protein
MKLNLLEIPVYYINMEKDIDKNKKIKKIISDCGFTNSTRVEGLEHKNPMSGCAASHYTILSSFEPPYIILEDDCDIKNFHPIIEVPDDSDIIYLGISSWGRMNSHSGPCVKYDILDNGLLKIYNMLSTHAMLFLTEEYCSICKNIAKYFYQIGDHLDIGFAEIQKYYNAYAFDDPMFYQTSSNGTDMKLSSYPSVDFFNLNRNFWKPLEIKK